MKHEVDLHKIVDALSEALSVFPANSSEMALQDMDLYLRINRLQISIVERQMKQLEIETM